MLKPCLLLSLLLFSLLFSYSSPSPPTSDESSFLAWADSVGVVHSLTFSHFDYSSYGGPSLVRGAAASKALRKGDVVVSVPLEALVTARTVEKDDVLREAIGRKAAREMGWKDEKQIITMYLLYHKGLGESSPIKPFIDYFFAADTSAFPTLWSPEEVAVLYADEHPEFHRLLASVLSSIDSRYEAVVPHLAERHPTLFGRDVVGPDGEWPYGFEKWRVAYVLVLSRYWTLELIDADPTAEEAVESNVCVDGEEDCEFRPPISEDSVFDEDGDDEYMNFERAPQAHEHDFVAPFADLLNFGIPCTLAEYNEADRRFEIYATCPFEKGDEVTFYYTNECRDHFIILYGFTHLLVDPCDYTNSKLSPRKSVEPEPS